MEVLFVLDSVENVERKIALFDEIGANIKFFVSFKNVAKIMSNKYIVSRIVAIYKNNVNVTIDKYIKSSNYKPQNTILYHSSAELTHDLINNIREKLTLKPDTIYIKKKFGVWSKIKLWFYHKIIKLIFGVNDEYASVKLQYCSAELMQALVETSFKNHIFNIPTAISIELDKTKAKTYYNKPKFDKNCLYNPIVMCAMLICYVLLEKFFKLPFWFYLFVIAIVLATIINLIIMIVKNNFDKRYKK